MNRSAQNSRRTRSAMFEALQPRELMAADAMRMAIVSDAYFWQPKLTGEEWAQQILSANENSTWTLRDKPLNDLKKFESEEQAKKYLTDALLKTWSEVLGKPVNNQLSTSYAYYDNVFLMSIRGENDLQTSVQGTSFATPDSIGNLSNSTNNQVSSVDEADRFEVSSSGFVYALGSNQDGSHDHIAIFDARDPKNLLKVATIDSSGWNTQMHLVGNQLILVSTDGQSQYAGGGSNVQVYDVSDANKPILQTSLTVSGGSLQSRFAAGQLTLYSSNYLSALRPLFISDNPNTVYAQLTETPIGRFETAEEFAARIQPLVIGWMLPDVKAVGSEVDLNGGDWNDLISGASSNYHSQISVLSFELTNSGLDLIDSESIIGGSMQTSYVDDNTVYIIAEQLNTWTNVDGTFVTRPPQTEIFAIEFNSDEVKFVASGVVPGTIRDSRMMDEFQGNLRVFSEVRNWSSDTASTDLYILKPDTGKLEIIGQLTDVADGQALYSAYFDEDQAFITTWITFQIDPLHGFDLSDPTKPVEMSELVIPGVSTYLQRVDETHLVGVGFVDVGNREWRQQISLYDVSDLTNFKVVDTWTSDVAVWPNLRGWNQNALALNFDPKTGLFSIASSAFGATNSNVLTVLKIETGDSPSLKEVGQLGDGKSTAFRSAVVGDSLLMISNAWLHSYSVDNLSVELDRELLALPGVSDWIGIEQGKSVQINLLENDNVAGGRITAISSSTIGATVTILDDGSTIEYKAPDKIENYSLSETLTYTVTLANGETYTGKLFVNTHRPWDYIPLPYIDPLPTIEPEPIIVKPASVACDINGDGEASPIDALLVINYLNQQSARVVAGEAAVEMSESNSVMDISKDGAISPIDALLIINLLNENAALRANGEASEALSARLVVDDFQANDAAMLAVLATSNTDHDEILRRNKKSQV